MTGREMLALPMPSGWQTYGSYTSLDGPAILLALMRTTLPWRYVPVDGWVLTFRHTDGTTGDALYVTEAEARARQQAKYSDPVIAFQGPQSLNSALAQARAEYSPTTAQTNTTPPASTSPTSTTTNNSSNTTTNQTSTTTPTPIAPKVTLANQTSGNAQQFKVGDMYRVDVTGSPNQPVSIAATHDGTSSQAVMGQTDSTGRLTLYGTMSQEHIGNWTETWKVAGVTATPTLSFSVVAAPATTPAPAADATNSNVSLIGDNSNWTSYLPTSVQDTVQQLAQSPTAWPWWAWAAAAAGVYFVFGQGKRR